MTASRSLKFQGSTVDRKISGPGHSRSSRWMECVRSHSGSDDRNQLPGAETVVQRNIFSARAFATAILLIACSATPAPSQIMTTNLELAHAVSPPLRDLAVSPDETRARREAEPARAIPLPAGLKPQSEPDAALQGPRSAWSPAPLAPAQFQSFDGLGAGVTGFTVRSAPPDSNGAVGLTQYVQWLNTFIAVYDKATGSIIGLPVPGNSLFAGLAGS